MRALGLRDFAGLRRDDDPLDPFALAHYAKLLVVDFDQIEGLSEEAREHLLGLGVNAWSGGTCSRPLPNGWRVVILNPRHGRARNNATLMEEVCHVFLGHKANRLSIVAQNKQGKTVARDYNDEDEEAAYSVGASALVPYSSLARQVRAGKSSTEIARHFNVSRELAEYRIKVTRLWPEYRARHEEEIAARYAAALRGNAADARHVAPGGDADSAASRRDEMARRRAVQPADARPAGVSAAREGRPAGRGDGGNHGRPR
ncbi:MAG: ImmA/IrrE family metallo-endopeptidase [Acidobacteria bacterium]|nr:ImmA/IrrE family metallo-endopeptidase [Acidobacteriota bacterium]